MGKALQDMLDHYEITRLVAEYCHACDRCDAEAMASTYWEDSWDNHGIDQAAGPEYARTTVPRIRAETEVMSHHLGQSLVRVEGDAAGVETYFIAVTLTSGADGAPMCNQLGGRYVDRVERRDGQWRLKDRLAVRDWSVSVRIDDDLFAAQGLTPGQRSSADPSWAALRMIPTPTAHDRA